MTNNLRNSTINSTYRFWVRVNGQPVRLSLVPGEYLTIHRGGPDDEGYHYAEDVYYIDREYGVLMFETSWESRDCDGCMSGGCQYWARFDELEVNHPCSDDQSRLERLEAEALRVRFPHFRELDAGFWRRDHQAEVAGF